MHRTMVGLACTAALAAGSANAARLSTDVVPENYAIRFVPDLAHDRFEGEETIRVVLRKPASMIVVNAAELAISDVRILSGGRERTAHVALDAAAQTATLTFDAPIPAGAAALRLRFAGTLGDQIKGFYRSHLGEAKYAVTQFEPADARRAFPSFDEPSFKATFDVSAVIDAKDMAISNGRVVSDVPGPAAGKHTVTFSTSPKMSSYLVALTVGDFRCDADSVDGIPLRVCAPPSYAGRTRFALDVAKASVRYYDDWFGIRYPFDKLDIAVGPDFIEGMENTGAIFANDAILIDLATASLQSQQNAAVVVSHEIAHQWFGDLVTMAWWDDTWLNEGFATWMENRPAEAMRPDWRMPRFFDAYGMEKDALRSTHPVRRPPMDDPNALMASFDIITYGKTSAVIRSLAAWLGQDTFRAGIAAYVKAHAYGNAKAEDLWDTLEQVSHRPVATVMRDFIDRPGIPLVRFAASCANGATTVAYTQERFWLNRPADAVPMTWHVPACLRDASGVHCELLDKPRGTIRIEGCSPWLMGNANMDGYYKSAYDAATLSALASHLRDLQPVERQSLVRDTWDVVSSGGDGIDGFLELVGRLDLSTDANLANAVAHDLLVVHDDIADPADRAAFEAWVRVVLRPAVAAVGRDAAPGDADQRRALRATLLEALGASGADPDTIAWANERARRYLDDPSTLDATLAVTVLDLAARHGNRTLFDAIEAKARAAMGHDDRLRYLTSLQAFADPALARRSLAIAQELLQPSERYFVMPGALRHPPTADASWQYIKEHWAELDANQLYFSRTAFVYDAGSFCDASHRDDVRAFFTRANPADDPGELAGAIERIDTCIGRREREHARLHAWLVAHAPGAVAAGRP